jgi:YVTN family beta-propeller protein
MDTTASSRRRPRSSRSGIACTITLAAFAMAQLPAAEPLPRRPGAQADGSVILPNQWSLRPVGKQTVVGDFPVAIALHPDGDTAVVLHCGHGPHELAVIDTKTRGVLSRTRVDEAFQGIAFSPRGDRLYVSGGGAETILIFRFENRSLIPAGSLAIRDAAVRGIPCGMAVSSDGRTLYVANVWGHSVSRIRLADVGGGAATSGTPDVADLLLSDKAPAPAPAKPATTDDPSITKRADALLERVIADAPHPWTCILDEPRDRLYVSLWAQAAVAVIDTRTWNTVGRIEVEEHPNEMILSPDGRRLFVANANRNSVSVIDLAQDLAAAKVTETLVATLTPDAAPGNTPNSLAISADGSRLYVSNANINALSVWDVHEPGASRSLGFIPVGWYPTCVRLTNDGKRLLVANGKGIISDSNRNGPRPGFNPEAPTPDYIGGLFDGTLSFIDLPQGEKAAAQLATWTERAFACRPPAAADAFSTEEVEGGPIPLAKGAKSPITHVIYIVKENRTYDQVLGDMPEGHGDPTLCLFPERVTPNHHALARQFVLLDNFYVESEVSADGHEWTMGAYATDFVERNWPLSYGHNRRNKFPYPSEGNFAAARPAGGYLWDRAAAAGVSFRSYGEWVTNGKKPEDPCTPRVKELEGRIDPFFRSFDQNYSDLKRADRFIAELARFEKEGDMPRLQVVRLPNDHTSGTSPGHLTPTAFVAENDLAFGRVVEAVSRSRFWPTTAIFVVEDDAQNGPDHIDAHRTIAFVISPWARHGAVDSSLYSTSSMLRTMELILGLEPMSQFDAAALPMIRSFAKAPVNEPYACRPAGVSLDEKNVATAWGARESLAMDLSVEDAADDLLFNEIIWRSVRGPDAAMPAPRRAAFVFSGDEDEDDDDPREERD